MTDWVATVILESDGNISNSQRRKALLEVINEFVGETDGDGVILFPAGYYDAGNSGANTLFKFTENEIRNELSGIARNVIVCLGIDGGKDQTVLAISKEGVLAIGRKFYPTDEEKRQGSVAVAKNYISLEEGRPRIFSLNGVRYFLAVCYDGFGIRRLNLQNPGVNIILNLVHGFGPKSSPYYFARDGFARTSQQWQCPVFGSAVFLDRKVMEWSSAIYQKEKVQMTWRYNSINWVKIFHLTIPEGKASVRIYDLENILGRRTV